LNTPASIHPAHKADSGLSPIPTTPENVVPFIPIQIPPAIPLHATPLQLRQHRRSLLGNLAHYHRTTKNPTARRMRDKLKRCGVSPTGKRVSFVRYSIHGQTIGGSVRGVHVCTDRFCPVCVARTETAEAMEIRAALLHLHHSGKLAGLRLIFFTATMGHYADDDHARNWETFRAVLSKLQSQRWWKAAIVGSIVKLEIEGTLDPDKSGLHPHAHLLIAIPAHVDSPALAARVQKFFKAEMARHYPGEIRIQWHREPSETWWQIVEGSGCLPRFLAIRRWTICEEVTASGAKYGGFWNRPVEDLVAVWGLMEGVGNLRPSGIFRRAYAAVRRTTGKPAVVTIARMTAAEWSALPLEIPDLLSAAVENINTDPAWIAWVLANRHRLTRSETHLLLIYLATADRPDFLPAVPSAAAARVVISGEALRIA
jgi:hypothetical protein